MKYKYKIAQPVGSLYSHRNSSLTFVGLEGKKFYNFTFIHSTFRTFYSYTRTFYVYNSITLSMQILTATGY